MKNKKIGIVTIHFPYNYGAMLQAYATQKFLEEKGIYSEIIDFRPYEIDKNYHIRVEMLMENPNLFIRMCVSKIMGKRKKYNKFEMFLKKEMLLSKKLYKKITTNNLLAYDILIAGSDQIWNPDIMQNRYEYVLNFGRDIKKISYASSFGKDKIDAEQAKRMKIELDTYSLISTREQQGIEILKNMGIQNAVKVCDPVFLLSYEKWNELKEKEVNISYRYVLIYSLQNNNEMNDAIKKYAREYGYKIVSVHPTGNKKEFADININNIGPKGFLSLIDGAECVFSNSFHATAFSIIFNKKIFTFLHSSTGSRVDNLLRQFKMEQKLDKKTGYNYYEQGEYTQQSIEELVKFSKEFLVNAL